MSSNSLSAPLDIVLSLSKIARLTEVLFETSYLHQYYIFKVK